MLDVLANRANFGTATGSVNIDGAPRDASFQRKIGYVQQEDLHLTTATVREALGFSALLRQSGPESREEKLKYVPEGLGQLPALVVNGRCCLLNMARKMRVNSMATYPQAAVCKQSYFY